MIIVESSCAFIITMFSQCTQLTARMPVRKDILLMVSIHELILTIRLYSPCTATRVSMMVDGLCCRGCSVNFDQVWMECEHGFGNMAGKCWLGLIKMHYLTASAP